MGDWNAPKSSIFPMETFLTTPKPRLSESFYTSGNISLYWEQTVSDYINLVYVPICSSFGIVGNCVAFCVLILSNLRHTTTCLYLAVIACLDTLVLVLNICFFLRRFPEFEIFNEWSCGMLMMLFFFTIHFDVMLLVAMTFERYIAVTYPLHASGKITMKKTVKIIIVLGLLSFALNVFNVFTRGMVEVHPGVTACSAKGDINIFFVEKIYTWIDSTIYCFIPVICLFTMNVKIIRVLEKAAAFQETMAPSQRDSSLSIATIHDAISQNDHVSNDVTSTTASPPSVKTSTNSTNTVTKTPSNGNKLETKSQQQATLMLILVSFAFLILAAPVAILRLIERYAWIPQTPHDRARQNLAHAVINNLMYTNHAVNFILYMLSGHKFRSEFNRIICRCRTQTHRK